MLLRKEDSCLVLIDVQEKLTPYVQSCEKLVARCEWMLRLAVELDVPQLISEQYPSGLGVTVEPLRHFGKAIDKVHFSCWGSGGFVKQLQQLKKNQIVLIGIETHVCVLQTALQLLEAGYQVFVVVDAVASRHELDHHYGLKRVKQSGGFLVTSEMVFFEWVEKAGTPEFKALSKAYLQG
ncbi:MAG: hydrolase [Legionellales bacterium RIFCSPHIGHO2_12_FULL_42_9]|nr:MAG: hydrolase [Legionellales bacterium RIFCSPHIGHO2_12_FULL_42_9]